MCGFRRNSLDAQDADFGCCCSVCADSGLNFTLVDIEVRVDVLHVIVFFQRFHQPEHLLGLFAGQLDVVLGNHRDFCARAA